MAKVIILCGKIASGKTYYANILKNSTNAIVLSVDDLMLKLSDFCLGDRHDDIAFRCESYFYNLSEQLIHSGFDVIIDYGYWLKRERIEARQYFNKKGIAAELHYIKAPEEVRKERLKRRNEELINEAGQAKERVYIIGDDLRKKLDLKFEEPLEEEVDKLLSY